MRRIVALALVLIATIGIAGCQKDTPVEKAEKKVNKFIQCFSLLK